MAEQPNDPRSIFRFDLEMICHELHASRVVPLAVSNPHGPLGLEQLSAAVAALRTETQSHPSTDRVRRPIELPVQTWDKLQALAATASEAGEARVSAGELAAAIIERYLLDEACS